MAREQVSISLRMDKDLHDRLEEQLNYGDTKSEWIRTAIEERLEQEEELD